MDYRCPLCQKKLLKSNRVLKCDNQHSFDLAKSGYVHLLPTHGQKISGDNKTMIQARTRHLESGFYQNLVDCLIPLFHSLYDHPFTVADCGCGEGYYTRNISQHCKHADIWGFDLSKEAILHASKHDPQSHYAISSVFDLPLFDKSIDVVLSIFAPIATEEFLRILKPDGFLITVSPAFYHLLALKQVLYDEPYLNKPFMLDHSSLQLVQEETLCSQIQLTTQDQIQNLFMMTPYYYKTPSEGKMKLAQLESLNIETAFLIQVWQKI